MGPVQFCSRCLYSSSHPLGLIIDEEGICSGCRIHEEKDRLDWNDRWLKLEALIQKYKSKSGRVYDCVVPVTGGQDSYYIVHLVKNRLKLNPLLVTYNKYYNTPLGIRNLANLRIKFDCDLLVQNVNPHSVKKITRTTLREFGSIYWHCLAGQSVFPVQTAVNYGIPLVIWGAHQGVEQVGMFSHEHAVQMTRRHRKDHDLLNVEADDLVTDFDTIKEEDIWQYRYPDDGDIDAVGVTGIYLGNYVRWDPKAQHEQMICESEYSTSSFPRTFDCYDYVDCYNYMGLHDLLKLYKHGYSKVTDHACREIRFRRLTRQQGMELVRKHELAQVQHVDLFSKWLGVSQHSLDFLLDRHRNRKFWMEASPGNWAFTGLSSRLEMQEAGLNFLTASINFMSTSKLRYSEADDRYVIIGKGFP